MNLIISEIKKRTEGISFDDVLEIKDKMLKRDSKILDIKDVTVTGNVFYDDGLYLLNYKLDYTIVLPSSRSMVPVAIHQGEMISEVFVENSDLISKSDLVEENLALVLEDGVIDLEESAIDNILLSIPMRVLTDEEKASADMPSGNNWSVLTESQYDALQKEKKQENNPFSRLEGLFKD